MTTQAQSVTIKIWHDSECPSPREDGGFGRLALFHRRYRLGDGEFRTPEELHEDEGFKRAIVKLPVYGYDHGGLVMNTTGFSCPWDSGQLGYIYITLADWTKSTGKRSVNAASKKRIEDMLRSVVEEYSDWVSGNCWGYSIIEDGEVIDSCGGFIGDRDQIRDHLPVELRGLETVYE